MKDISKDILTLAKVFLAVVAGLIVFAAFFGVGAIDTWIYGLLLVINIVLATLIAVLVMVILIVIGGRFFRLF